MHEGAHVIGGGRANHLLQFFAQPARLFGELPKLCVDSFFRSYFFHGVSAHTAALAGMNGLASRMQQFSRQRRIS
jgi:hypothetical protein